jgi:hypothetical protein
MLKEGDRQNFDTIQRACEAGDLALVECADAVTGAYVAVVCAMQHDGDEIEIVPLARMFDGNPYEALISPVEAAS